MPRIRKLIIAGLAALVLNLGGAGCAKRGVYLLQEEHPAIQQINYQNDGFDFYKAEKMLRENPEKYPDYLKSLK